MRSTKHINLASFEASLVLAYFLCAPFTWSYIVRVDGFYLRPTDIAIVLLILTTGLTGRLRKSSLWVMVPFAPLAFLLMLRGIVFSDLGAVISAAKILYYATGITCLVNVVLRMVGSPDAGLNRWVLRGMLTYLAIMSVFAVSNVAGVIRGASLSGLTQAIYWVVHSLFQFNFFGPSGVVDVVGIPFRNSMGGGFLAASLFFYFTTRRFRGLAAFFFVAAALSMSRSIWVAQGMFLFALLLFAGWRTRAATVLVLLAGALVTVANRDVVDVLIQRATSAFGRSEILSAALPDLDRGSWFGTVRGAQVELLDGSLKSVHNVPLALTLEVGVLGGAIAVLTLAVILGIVLAQLAQAITGRSTDPIRSTVVVAAGTLLVVRPMVSASFENFYSIGEWGAFGLFVAILLSPREVRGAAREQNAGRPPVPGIAPLPADS